MLDTIDGATQQRSFTTLQEQGTLVSIISSQSQEATQITKNAIALCHCSIQRLQGAISGDQPLRVDTALAFSSWSAHLSNQHALKPAD